MASNHHRARRWLLAAAIGLVIAALPIPAILCENALHIPAQARYAPQAPLADAVAHETGAAWQSVEIAAVDSAVLRAWCFTPRQTARGVVILLHGVADTRQGVMGQAQVLLRHDYAVLTPDARGHGASGGDRISYGIKESADVHRWADWLCARQHVDGLYGLGESMGAAILLQSLRVEPRFRAVVAECSFATFEEIAYDRLRQFAGLGHVTAWALVEPAFFYARMFYGLDLRLASPAEMVRSTRTPILLIHGTADNNIAPRHSRSLHALNPATEIWEVPGAGHVSALASQPELFERMVVDWFRTHP